MQARAASALLVLLFAGDVHAGYDGSELDPAAVGDAEAQKQYPYLQRKPQCAADKKGKLSSLVASKTLHQIWWQGEAEIPAHFGPLQNTWRVQHPEWTFKFWDEAAIVALVDSSPYKWFAPTFHALPSKIQKADAARYVILHAEGGLYADLDVEAFRPFDEVVDAKETRGSVLFFEEPATHWDAHGTVVSNGLIAAPKGHPLLVRLLRAIRPVSEVFASGGSHMLQATLQACRDEEDEDEGKGCGCFVTKSAADYFPLHAGMRRPEEFVNTASHAKALRAFVADLTSGSWPPKAAYSAQYWTVSWIDPDIGRLFLDAIAAARAADRDRAEKMFYATMWSKWGTKYKYRGAVAGGETKKARDAYERSIDLSPNYAFGYYELANIELEAEEPTRALPLLTNAISLRPSVLLFHNNMGVAQLGLGHGHDAEASFRKVLDLEAASFATIKGVSPRAGATLNLGIALAAQGRQEEANAAYRAALADGTSFHYGLQAAQRLKEAGADVGPDDLLSLTLGDALFKEGRTREAALRFASAHQHAGSEATREKVAQRMNALAEVWDLDPTAKARAAKRERKGSRGGSKRPSGGVSEETPDLTIHQAGPDGKTQAMNLGKLTPELLAKLKGEGVM